MTSRLQLSVQRMMAEDKHFEQFKKFKKWVEAIKESSGDRLSSYQDFLKFKAASEFPESGK